MPRVGYGDLGMSEDMGLGMSGLSLAWGPCVCWWGLLGSS